MPPIPAAREVLREKRAKLVVVRALDHGNEPDKWPPGTELALDRSPVVFGLTDTGLPDKRDHALYLEGLGRPHAYFELRDKTWFVCDAGSTSGTWVARKKVTEHKLTDGDRIALGAIGDPNVDDGSGVVLEYVVLPYSG
jgi:hypothetical protein